MLTVRKASRVRSFAALAAMIAMTIVGCGTDKSTAPAVDYNLTVVSGNSQVATDGDPLTAPVVVKLTNAASGAPVPNATITWQPASGSGSPAAGATTTDANGSSSTSWTLGATDSAQSLVASTPNASSSGPPLTVTFTATGFARGALHWVGVFDGDSMVATGTSYSVAAHYHFAIANAQNDSVSSAPVVNVPSIQWMLVTGAAPSPPPSCSVATDVLTLNCPPSSGTGYDGFYVVTVQEGSFDGIANPAYRGTFDLYVGATTSPQLHLTGAFDGDSSVAIGTPYNVVQHFHFIIADAAGDSVGSVPVANLPSALWMLATPLAPSAPPSCSVTSGVLTLTCPASSGQGYNGFFTVTVQPGTVTGVTNPSYLGTFDLYVGPTSTVQLHFTGVFDGDSAVGVDTAYNVAQHFHFVVADASGDSIGSVPVVNLPATQWVFQSGATPTTPPACPTTVDVLVLNCPASDAPATGSGGAYTGYYVVTVQPGSLNGVTNPAYRPTFDLNVTPGLPIIQCTYANGVLTCLSAQSASARHPR